MVKQKSIPQDVIAASRRANAIIWDRVSRFRGDFPPKVPGLPEANAPALSGFIQRPLHP